MNWPVTGSAAAVPETNTGPAALTAWLWAGGGLAAFAVKMMLRAMVPSSGVNGTMWGSRLMAGRRGADR